MNEDNETLVNFGGSVKRLEDTEDGKLHVGGVLVRFGDPDDTDADMEFFTKDTFFGMKPGEKKHTPVWFNHRVPFKSKGGDIWVRDPIGEGWMELTEDGVLIDAIIDAREVYEGVLDKLGWSSGTAARFTDREAAGKASRITHWPLGLDASMTFGPAEPRNIVTAKSLADLETDADLKGLLESVANAEASPTIDKPAQETTPAILKEKTMSDEIKDAAAVVETEQPDENAAIKALEGRVDQLSAGINQILQQMQDTPKVRKSGYFTEDGGTADPGVKSFGDFLMAVKRKDVDRLAGVYKISQKDLLQSQGTTGGFLVPEEFSNQLLQMAEEASPIMQRVTTVPVGSNAGSFPALDYSVSPTAGSGQTAMAAGMSAATTEEGAALTEDQPGFKQITWRVHKVGGFTQASNELIADSPQAIEVILNRMFAITIANKNERN
ncbi:MAG: phage major capsid protein, partial [Dehalococcoidia bacterium]